MRTVREILEAAEGAWTWTNADAAVALAAAKQRFAQQARGVDAHLEIVPLKRGTSERTEMPQVKLLAEVEGTRKGKAAPLMAVVQRAVVGRGGEGSYSHMEAGAYLGGEKVIPVVQVPQSKEPGWAPDPKEFGIEAGDMAAQLVEMAVRDHGFEPKK